ncbi:MAG: hypothetical protein ACREDP_15420, partial [Bradyrhizobium sp.]
MYQHRTIESAEAAKALASPTATTLPHLTVSAILAGIDFLVVALCVGAATMLYKHVWINDVVDLENVLALSAASGAVVFLVLLMRHRYQLRNIVARRAQVVAFLQAWGLCILLALWAAFLTKTTATFSRGAMSLAFGPGFLLAFACRMAVVEGIRRLFMLRRLQLTSAFLIHAGDQSDHDRVVSELSDNGIAITGIHKLDLASAERDDIAIGLIEAIEAARQTLAAGRYDTIYLSLPWGRAGLIDDLRSGLSRLPLPVYLLPDVATRTVIAGQRMELA